MIQVYLEDRIRFRVKIESTQRVPQITLIAQSLLI